jgi:flavorubredoxin
MTQYDEKRRTEHFQVSRSFVRQLIEKLKHKMDKKDTKYMCMIHVSMRVACSLYKLAHASEYL